MTDLDVAPPLTAKVQSTTTAVAITLVSSAASLLEGDHLTIRLRVGPSSHVTVRSAGAQLAHPCPNGGRTTYVVEVDVAAGSTLCWLTEPLVVAGGARHTSELRVRLAAGATVLWRDELILGRSGEDPMIANVQASLRVTQDGRPIFVDGTDTSAPGAFSSAVLGAGTRFIGTLARFDPTNAARPACAEPPIGTRFELASGDMVWRVLGSDVANLRRQLDALERVVMAEISPQG